ncbi:MAG: hypothetical protein M1150_00905 [Patescibacteria group bacterium]|nr:hypothetical protein [Patescibacteria group bacterium]
MKVIKNAYQNQSGQMLIIIVLILVVGITIALSLVSRSVTDVRLSTNTEQSNRAYTAAEAGIEDALRKIASSAAVGTGSASFSDSDVKYNISEAAGTSFGPTEAVKKDDVSQLDLKNYTGNSVNISWHTSSDSTPAAIVASFIYKTSSEYTVQKWAFNDNSTYPTRVIGFADVSGGRGGGYTYNTTLTLPAHQASEPNFLRVRPLFGDTHIQFSSDNMYVNLPVQGYEITATGSAGSSERTVKVFKSKPALPSIFDYVLFSGGSLSK